ncbi:MAG: hypothetical protein AAGM22_16110 [Acidobacteriota bacterium]
MSLAPTESDSKWLRTLGPWLDAAGRALQSFSVRGVLSALIVVSILPPKLFAQGERLWPVFLAVFGAEFVLRLVILIRDRLRLELRVSELLILGLDLLALLSFLPVWPAKLQILRLVRLLLLLGYWRGLLLELWGLLTHQERRYQIGLVLLLGAVLAFGSAALLVEVGVAHDFDGNGVVDAGDTDFGVLLWWSFRQIQEPGNLVTSWEDPRLVVVSLLLTFSGLLLFSFFIGIGTTVVGELVERARQQPVGFGGHTVILGATSYTGILLRQLSEAYRKNSRTYRGALMADPEEYDLLRAEAGRQMRFRPGDPSRVEDLRRVNVERAKRVIILGNESRDPDAAVISATLATRRMHSDVALYLDLEHERNAAAARVAGGRRTHIVGSGAMLGYYVAQNVSCPGIHRLYRHLLQSSDGCEIYTYIFDAAERRGFPGRTSLDLEAVDRLALERHRTTLLGFLVAEDPEEVLEDDDLDILLHPLRAAGAGIPPDEPAYALDGSTNLRAGCLRGIIGIAPGFRDLAGLGRRLGADKIEGVDSEEPSEPFGDLELRPARRAPERVLILGAGPRVPRVVMELIGAFGALEITVVAGVHEPSVQVAHDMRVMLEEAFGTPPVDLEGTERSEVRLRVDSAAGVAEITLRVADWAHGHVLEAVGPELVEAVDILLFLPSLDIAEDRDGRIALDCLHLAHLAKTGDIRFKPEAHVLALMRDPAKGDLLDQRLLGMGLHTEAGGGTLCRFTITSRERARHRFLMQSVFVRGLNAIYLHLLSSRGLTLRRVLPARRGDPEESLDLGALRRHLRTARGLRLVGFEHAPAPRGRVAVGPELEIVADPRRLCRGSSVPWSEVRAIYVLG